MAATTDWYIDIEEVWTGQENAESFTHNVSFGPLRYDTTQDISVQQFIDDVNELFFRIHLDGNSLNPAPPLMEQDGGTHVLYKMEAQAAKTIEDNLPPDRLTPVPFEQQIAFAIRYFIKIDPSCLIITTAASYAVLGDPGWGLLESFQVKFRDGEHGYITPHTPNGLDDSDIPRAAVHWENYSDTRFASVPYWSQTAAILDSPPVPPNIRVIPYIGVNNRLLILLNSNTGEYRARPVVIKDFDTTAIANHYVSQTGVPMLPGDVRSEIGIPSSPLKLLYQNDDPISRYEIFRITKKPTSYEDFNTAQNPYKIVTGEITSFKSSSSAFLVDVVEPNTKYYYCVRAVDIHNNFSNPTHVFEAELVDNEGQVYLILKTIIFETDVSDNYVKTGRRFVYIEPSVRNFSLTTVPPPGSTVDDNPNPTSPIFGSPNEGASCWNKTFKVRLTSKKSNKKIDLNILFKNTGVINP